MTDLHDLNTRNERKTAEFQGNSELMRKFGSKQPALDTLCYWCGEHYGAHIYDKNVDAWTKCPHPEMKETDEDWRERIKKFWVCWVQGAIVNDSQKYFTLLDAENEAERLAKLPDMQGKEVYIFECVGKCYTVPSIVAWVVTR